MILVTGGAGYIGSLVSRLLLEQGDQVVILDNLSGGSKIPDWCPFVRGDVRRKEDLRNTFREFKINSVMHFAALIDVAESLNSPDLYYDNNSFGTEVLCDVMSEFGCEEIIFSSTAAVYSAISTSNISEDSPTAPVTPYGASKLQAEKLIAHRAAMKGWKATAFRYFNVAGASIERGIGQRYKKSLFKQLALAAATGKPFVVNGTDYPTPDGSAVRDYIHVEDLADAHILACRAPKSGFRCFNVGYGKGVSVLEAAKCMRKVASKDFEISIGPRREGDLSSVVAKADYIRRELNWVPKHDSILEIARSAYQFELLKLT